MKRLVLITGLGVLVLASGSLLAQVPVGTPSDNPPSTSGSGTQSAGAAEADVKAAFDKIDAYRDGKIARNETNSYPMLNSQFNSLDKDKNGSLSLQEYTALGTVTETKPKS